MTNRQNSLFRESYSSNLIEKYFVDFLVPVPGVMGSNPPVSGVVSRKLTLAARFIQSSLWRGLAKIFDFDRIR